MFVIARDIINGHWYSFSMAAYSNHDSISKSLGAYYTPSTLADMLAQWTVRTGSERILEPSVGEGALVDAALRHAGRISGYSNVSFTVCDIDPTAIEAIRVRVGDKSDVRAIDFLQLDPASTGLFDAVLANPPFTRNHEIDQKRRLVLRRRFQTAGAAGLWVHFLVHSVTFLRDGGRMAAVIPAAALFSDYGRECLKRVCSMFAEVELREIVDRPMWSQGADERGALLFADGYGLGSSELPKPLLWSSRGTPVSHPLVSSDDYDDLVKQTTTLGTMASLSIGAVTGYNRVFLIDDATRKAQQIRDEDLQAIVSRSRHIPGLFVDGARLLELARRGEKTWLLAPEKLGEKGGGIRHQLAKISARRRASTVWFQKRDPWWKVEFGPPADAIFTYMNDRGPRLVLATGDVRCTNTLHYVRFKTHISQAQQLAASLSLVSTFGQLAAERLGRSYGGGLLKFELKDARKFPILPPQANLRNAFERADSYLMRGQIAEATAVADEVLLGPLLGNDLDRVVRMLGEEKVARRKLRRGETEPVTTQAAETQPTASLQPQDDQA